MSFTSVLPLLGAIAASTSFIEAVSDSPPPPPADLGRLSSFVYYVTQRRFAAFFFTMIASYWVFRLQDHLGDETGGWPNASLERFLGYSCYYFCGCLLATIYL